MYTGTQKQITKIVTEKTINYGKPIFICYTGSYLYNIQTENSDIDIMSVYIPSLEKCLFKPNTINPTQEIFEFEYETIDVTYVPLISLYKQIKKRTFNSLILSSISKEKILMKDPIWENISKYIDNLQPTMVHSLKGYISNIINTYKTRKTIKPKEFVQCVLSLILYTKICSSIKTKHNMVIPFSKKITKDILKIKQNILDSIVKNTTEQEFKAFIEYTESEFRRLKTVEDIICELPIYYYENEIEKLENEIFNIILKNTNRTYEF